MLPSRACDDYLLPRFTHLPDLSHPMFLLSIPLYPICCVHPNRYIEHNIAIISLHFLTMYIHKIFVLQKSCYLCLLPYTFHYQTLNYQQAFFSIQAQCIKQSISLARYWPIEIVFQSQLVTSCLTSNTNMVSKDRVICL